jgi:hypothetical protein
VAAAAADLESAHAVRAGPAVPLLLRRRMARAASWQSLSVFISESGKHPTLSPVALFKDHLRLLGANPANWTKQPIG